MASAAGGVPGPGAALRMSGSATGETRGRVQGLLGATFTLPSLIAITTAYQVRYVFQPRIMTQDKLFGAATAYLLISVLWASLYAIIGFFYPQSYMIVGQP